MKKIKIPKQKGGWLANVLLMVLIIIVGLFMYSTASPNGSANISTNTRVAPPRVTVPTSVRTKQHTNSVVENTAETVVDYYGWISRIQDSLDSIPLISILFTLVFGAAPVLASGYVVWWFWNNVMRVVVGTDQKDD